MNEINTLLKPNQSKTPQSLGKMNHTSIYTFNETDTTFRHQSQSQTQRTIWTLSDDGEKKNKQHTRFSNRSKNCCIWFYRMERVQNTIQWVRVSVSVFLICRFVCELKKKTQSKITITVQRGKNTPNNVTLLMCIFVFGFYLVFRVQLNTKTLYTRHKRQRIIAFTGKTPMYFALFSSSSSPFRFICLHCLYLCVHFYLFSFV